MAETTEQSGATESASHRGRPKTRTGIVTSNKMQKTVVVTVRRRASRSIALAASLSATASVIVS